MESLFDFDVVVKDLNEIPIEILAYIGDAFYNLYISMQSIGDGRITSYSANKLGNKHKCAKAQKIKMESLINILKNDEIDFYKRGVNSRGAKKRGNDEDYRMGTGFETLLGYLVLRKDWARLKEVLKYKTND